MGRCSARLPIQEVGSEWNRAIEHEEHRPDHNVASKAMFSSHCFRPYRVRAVFERSVRKAGERKGALDAGRYSRGFDNY